MTPTVHIESWDALMFCGVTIPPQGASVTYHGAVVTRIDHHGLHRVVFRAVWQEDRSEIQRATCTDCLMAVVMLGDSARIALERMGLKVEVRDVGEPS